jgi:hypothetical protein
MGTISDLLRVPTESVLAGPIRDYIGTRIGKWIGFPGHPEDSVDQALCASILLNSYELSLTGDKVEVWFYQPENPDLGAHTLAQFRAHVRFDFMPAAEDDPNAVQRFQNEIRRLSGCDELGELGPVQGVTVLWKVGSPLEEHGSMLPRESVTDTHGDATSAYQVGTRETVPPPLRRDDEVETFTGSVTATAVRLLRGFPALEAVVDGTRDETSPHTKRLGLGLSHYRRPATSLRYSLVVEQFHEEDYDTGPPFLAVGHRSYAAEFELEGEIRLVRIGDDPLEFKGVAPLTWVRTFYLSRDVGAAQAGDNIRVRCGHDISATLVGARPRSAHVRRLVIEPALLGMPGITLDWDPDLDSEERFRHKYVTTFGPCPGSDNYRNEAMLSGYYMNAHSAEQVFLAEGRAVRIRDWVGGAADVFASRTFTVTRPNGVSVRERFELVGRFDA